MGQFRTVKFIDAVSCEFAVDQIELNCSELTCIDMTQDFNQNKWLGQELSDTLIFFDTLTRPNALLAVFSCVKGGATLFIACNQATCKTYFKRHILIPKLAAIEQQTGPNYSPDKKKIASPILADKYCKDKLNELLQVFSSNNVMHLVGPRGSGKSTLLGHFVNELGCSNESHIALITQYKTSAKNTLKVLNDVSREILDYLSPNHIKEKINDYKFILIDEAATLPKQLIEYVEKHAIKNNKKLILSTTTEGYEGTGQSYRLNYTDQLAAISRVVLTETHRFSSDDPLHKLSQQFCQPKVDKLTIADGIYTYDNIALRENDLTESCFALLQQSHYKTTPNDLERFYDDDGVFVLMFRGGFIISALYALPEKLSYEIDLSDIFYGRRRVKNALTQQSLIVAYGENTELAAKRILRISRIATQREYRQKGYASQLIATLMGYAMSHRYDLLSTSFTVQDVNIAEPASVFWHANHFQPVRLSLNKNKWSNGYSQLMLYDLTTNTELIETLGKNYTNHLVYYQFRQNKIVTNSLSKKEIIKQIDSVVNGYRDIHWLMPILWSYTQSTIDTNFQLIHLLLTRGRIEKSNLGEAKLLLKNYLSSLE